MIESLPRRGRWPRLRPRPDEARLYRYYPCTGCGCKVCPHQSAAADSFPRGGKPSGGGPMLGIDPYN